MSRKAKQNRSAKAKPTHQVSPGSACADHMQPKIPECGLKVAV